VAPILANRAMQTLLQWSKVPIPEKKLHFSQARLFREAASRIGKAFLNRPTKKTLLDLLILSRVLGLGVLRGAIRNSL
jgi:hypothetical protein